MKDRRRQKAERGTWFRRQRLSVSSAPHRKYYRRRTKTFWQDRAAIRCFRDAAGRPGKTRGSTWAGPVQQNADQPAANRWIDLGERLPWPETCGEEFAADSDTRCGRRTKQHSRWAEPVFRSSTVRRRSSVVVVQRTSGDCWHPRRCTAVVAWTAAAASARDEDVDAALASDDHSPVLDYRRQRTDFRRTRQQGLFWRRWIAAVPPADLKRHYYASNNNKTDCISVEGSLPATWRDTLFCFCDLDLNTMTLISGL